MSMEYRCWIEIPGLPYSQEADHERLLESLLESHVELGPVMSWSDDRKATLVVLSVDAPTEGSAVAEMEAAVGDSLRSTDLGHLTATPSLVEAVAADATTAPA
jgi:hypothetical protein